MWNYKQKINNIRQKEIRNQKIIVKAFNKNKGIYGRQKLVAYIKNNYQIEINYCTLGRGMQQLSLFCKIRQKRKAREIKNTNVKFFDLVWNVIITVLQTKILLQQMLLIFQHLEI
ncbi:transposase [Candidatus Mycoplasma pogonae]